MVKLFDYVNTPNGIGKVVGIKCFYNGLEINEKRIYVSVYFNEDKGGGFKWRTYSIKNIKEIE